MKGRDAFSARRTAGDRHGDGTGRPWLDARMQSTLQRYADLLQEANTRFNLTAIRDPAELWKRHIEESIGLRAWLPLRGRVMDLGSGGGVPGIPLAIVCPEVSMVLTEATGKKAAFLRHVLRALALENAEVLEGRAESWGHSPGHRGCYDAVVARAVAALPELLELTVPFLKTGGCLLAVKGARVQAEIEAARGAFKRLRARLEGVDRPGAAAREPLVARVRKWGPTPALYPRSPGVPRKHPLAG